MNSIQQRVFDSLERSDSFTEKYPNELGSIVTSQARQDLRAVIAEVRLHDTNQGGAIRTLEGQMNKKVALAKELVHSHLRPIAKFAKGKLRGVPEYAELTATGNPTKVTKLITVAHTMAEAAAKYADKFTAAGLAPDTVNRLIAATDALENVLSQRVSARQKRKSSTNSLDTVLARGRDAVKVLESAITQVLKSGDPLLATWKTESRIQDKPGKPRQNKKATAVQSTAPAAAQHAAVTASVASAPAALPASTTQHAG
jgi:hypothetical protein